MLRAVEGLKGFHLQARDGQLGKVDDFFFDDEKWTIRYLVVDTNIWIPDGRVLISPSSFLDRPDWKSRVFPVSLTKEEVKNSPDVNVHQPVSRAKEIEVNYYYGWPNYWYAPSSQGDITPTAAPPRGMPSHVSRADQDSHLRSINEVTGYHIMAIDGEIGHVEDMIVDDEDWSARYLVVDTRNLLPGKKVLLSIGWVKTFDWEMRKVDVDLKKDSVKKSPPYNPSTPVNRQEEEALFDYYGRPRYWL